VEKTTREMYTIFKCCFGCVFSSSKISLSIFHVISIHFFYLLNLLFIHHFTILPLRTGPFYYIRDSSIFHASHTQIIVVLLFFSKSISCEKKFTSQNLKATNNNNQVCGRPVFRAFSILFFSYKFSLR
jgi:hypothetical protein